MCFLTQLSQTLPKPLLTVTPLGFIRAYKGLQRRQPNFSPRSVHEEFRRIASKQFKHVDTLISGCSSRRNRLDSLSNEGCIRPEDLTSIQEESVKCGYEMMHADLSDSAHPSSDMKDLDISRKMSRSSDASSHFN